MIEDLLQQIQVGVHRPRCPRSARIVKPLASPSTTSTRSVSWVRGRKISTVIVSPGLADPRRPLTSLPFWVTRPSMERIKSPARIPARSAGPPGMTDCSGAAGRSKPTCSKNAAWSALTWQGELHAQHGMGGPSVGDEIRNHPINQLDRNGQTHPWPGVLVRHRGAHADHSAQGVGDGSAGVARVNRGIDLQEVFEHWGGPTSNTRCAPQAAHNATGNAELQFQR